MSSTPTLDLLQTAALTEAVRQVVQKDLPLPHLGCKPWPETYPTRLTALLIENNNPYVVPTPKGVLNRERIHPTVKDWALHFGEPFYDQLKAYYRLTNHDS